MVPIVLQAGFLSVDWMFEVVMLVFFCFFWLSWRWHRNEDTVFLPNKSPFIYACDGD